MAKITKELKYASFEYNEDTQTFSVKDSTGNKIELNKVYSFAFMRFVIRIAQRNWLRTKKIEKPSKGAEDWAEVDGEVVQELKQSLLFADDAPEAPELSDEQMDKLLGEVKNRFGEDTTPF